MAHLKATIATPAGPNDAANGDAILVSAFAQIMAKLEAAHGV